MATRCRFVRSGLVSAWMATASIAQAQQCDEIFPARRLDIGGSPGDVQVADFNLDGRPDLFFTLVYDNRAVGVALGLGDRRFAAFQTTDPSIAESESWVAELNGDGIPDLLVLGSTVEGYPSFAQLIGKGDGWFGTPRRQAAAKNIHDPTTGDFNGDGLADVAYGELKSDIRVRLNNADGTFGDEIITPVRMPIRSHSAGDLDGDGRTDLVGIMSDSSSARLVLAFGRGDGTFETPVEIESRDNSPRIVDADGDGLADIVTVAYDRLNVGRGLGGRRFAEPIPVACCVISLRPWWQLLDMDGDGVRDFVVTHSPAWVSICRGLGGASWADPVTYESLSYYDRFAASDFDGDGDGDLVFADDLPALVPSERGVLPQSTFLTEWFLEYDFDASLRPVDADGDGAPDLLLRAPGADPVVFFGDGRGGIAGHTIVRPASPMVLAAALGDADGDGVLDMLITTDAYGRLWVHRGLGDRTFADPAGFLRTGYKPRNPVVADFNGDGVPDLATANEDMADDTVSVLIGTGGGAFAEQRFVRGGVFHPSVMAIADINGDGHPDIATGGWNGVGIVLGRGDGTFDAARAYDTGWEVSALLAADFNRDGRADLAAAGAIGDRYPGAVIVFLGDAKGGLTSSARIETRSPPGDIAAADMNGDGVLDLVVQWGTAVAFGRGDGTFEPPTYYWPGGPGTTNAVADLDGDRNPDLVFYDAQLQGLAMVRNTGLCAACPPDCDRSGRLDINDFICFQSAWRRRDPYGDYDRSGRFDVNDFLAFADDWRRTVIDGGCR